MSGRYRQVQPFSYVTNANALGEEYPDCGLVLVQRSWPAEFYSFGLAALSPAETRS
jgi:hypothetical protein